MLAVDSNRSTFYIFLAYVNMVLGNNLYQFQLAKALVNNLPYGHIRAAQKMNTGRFQIISKYLNVYSKVLCPFQLRHGSQQNLGYGHITLYNNFCKSVIQYDPTYNAPPPLITTTPRVKFCRRAILVGYTTDTHWHMPQI